MTAEKLTHDTLRQERQLVTFLLAEEEFGFDIMVVQEIIRPPKMVRLPLAPNYVEGLANLRGAVMPIIDARARFGLPRQETTDRTRILVLDVEGQRLGLRVDHVRQVTRIEGSACEHPPAVLRAGMSADYLQHIVKLDEGRRLIMVLNPYTTCAMAELEKAISDTTATTYLSTTNEAVPTTREEQHGYTQLVSFKLRHEEFAFPMEQVREILRIQRITEAPNMPPYLLGMLTVRGEILPVIDLRVLLGLPKFGAELSQTAQMLAEQYRLWQPAKVSVAMARETGAPYDLRKWLNECITGSAALAEITRRIKDANEKVIQIAERLQKAGTQDVNQSDDSLATVRQQVFDLLSQFQAVVVNQIFEDQRLIVVQTQTKPLALLVDKVREVLHVPLNQIGAPPSVTATEKNTLQGIAKLDAGKRLVMLLDANRLIDAVILKEITASSQTVAGAEIEQHESATKTQRTEDQQFVIFRMEDGEYGVPVSQVQEIDRVSKMVRVPQTPEYVDGVTNLRGEIIPVVNARRRFNLAEQAADERTRVLIIDHAGVKTGLLVDAVREVLNLPSTAITPPPAALTSAVDREYIAGIAQIEGEKSTEKRLVIILQVEKVLAYELSPAA